MRLAAIGAAVRVANAPAHDEHVARVLLERLVRARVQRVCFWIPDDLVDADQAPDARLAVDGSAASLSHEAPTDGSSRRCSGTSTRKMFSLVAVEGSMSPSNGIETRGCWLNPSSWLSTLTSSQSDRFATQSAGSGRFTRRPVICSGSVTVKRSEGNGLVAGDERSKRGWTALSSCPNGRVMSAVNRIEVRYNQIPQVHGANEPSPLPDTSVSSVPARPTVCTVRDPESQSLQNRAQKRSENIPWAAMTKGQTHSYEFGPFTLDPAKRLLLRGVEPVPLQPKAFDTLLLLVDRRGEMLAKEELISRLWPDSFVEESNLSQTVYVLRKALGRDEAGSEYIKTVPKRGYQFVADVRDRGDTPREEDPRLRAAAGESEMNTAARDAANDVPGAGTIESTKAHAAGGSWKLTLPVLISAVLAVGLSVIGYRWFASRAETPAEVKSIAVLPFKPLAAGDRDESLELGMADTLITRLGSLRQVVVRPISAVRGYTDLGKDPAEAGRELRVDAVLDGSLQRDRSRVRVTARLVRVENGGTLWSGTFDENFTDIFFVQDSISARVAQSLSLRLSGEEELRLARRDTRNTEAYLLYVKGRYFWNKRTPDGLQKGAEHFQQAIDLDGSYALAYSGLADSYFSLGSNQWVPVKEARTKGLEAARLAVQLDPALAEARTSLAAGTRAFRMGLRRCRARVQESARTLGVRDGPSPLRSVPVTRRASRRGPRGTRPRPTPRPCLARH